METALNGRVRALVFKEGTMFNRAGRGGLEMVTFELGYIWTFREEQGQVISIGGNSRSKPGRYMEYKTIGSHNNGKPWSMAVYTLNFFLCKSTLGLIYTWSKFKCTSVCT